MAYDGTFKQLKEKELHAYLQGGWWMENTFFHLA